MTVRALGLFSGGLDSILAVRVLQEQGVLVTGISFVTPFFTAAAAERAARQLDIELLVEDITDVHLEMVKRPPHGYGSAMNPCIDCHALMIRVAGTIMHRRGYDFVFTGEVLNERPMSQTRRSLAVVAEQSGMSDYLLRPLSALLLEPIQAERRGVIDRSRLLDLQGRGRKRQMELAQRYGVPEYPNPAGGCLLTDKNFGRRLKDLLEIQPEAGIRDYRLLRIGRHFRFSPSVKFILGRNQSENDELETLFLPDDIMMWSEQVPGPRGLLVGAQLRPYVETAGRICAAYSDAADGSRVLLSVRDGDDIGSVSAVSDRRMRVYKKIE